MMTHCSNEVALHEPAEQWKISLELPDEDIIHLSLDEN